VQPGLYIAATSVSLRMHRSERRGVQLVAAFTQPDNGNSAVSNAKTTILWMLAIGVVLAACAGPLPQPSAGTDLGSDFGSSHGDLAKWSVGPDNMSP
jgi:hypothetical protein